MRKIFEAAILILATIGLVYAIYALMAGASDNSEVRLPLLAIAGVVLLLAALALVSIAFGIFGLSDKTQALALPEGSIRAVLALSLVVLFAILSVYLYQGLASGGLRTVLHLTEAEKSQFLKDNMTAHDIVVKESVIKSTGGTEEKNYAITYRAPNNQPSDDFAKQLLVMIGTLMTAMASFYFGARTAAASQTTDAARLLPTVRSIQPESFSLATGSIIEIHVLGDNLNSIKQVKIVNQGNQVQATEVVSNDSLVKCKVAVSATTTPPGKWDVVVIDGASRSASLPGALTIIP